jgi:hypothetical protein
MDWPVIASSAITGVVGIGGVLLGGHFTRRTEQRMVANEDERRWLADRRHVLRRLSSYHYFNAQEH